MKRNFVFLLLTFFTVLIAGILLAVPAAGATYNAPGAIFSAAGETPAPAPGGTPVFPEDAEISVSGDAEGAERSEDGGTVTVVLTGKDVPDGGEAPEKRTATLSVSEDVDLSAFDALSVDVCFTPADGVTVPSCALIVSVYADGDILRFRAELFPGSVKTAVIDVTPLKDRSSVKRISATLEWDNVGEGPGEIVFSRLCATEGVKTPAASMSSLSVSSGKGKLTADEDSFTLVPSGGVAELFAVIDPGALPEAETEEGTVPVRYAALTLVSDGGSVSAEFNGGSCRDPESALSALTRMIFPGEHIYLFRFASDEAQTVRFTFQSPGGGAVTCKSLEFFAAGSYDPYVDSAGCSLDCSVKDGALSVEGKLKKSTAVEFAGKKLGLFTVPAVGGETVKLAESRAGSAFSFSVPLSSLPRNGRENYFWVSVLYDGGDVRISDRIFLLGARSAEGNASAAGLYGAEPAGVFEAGMNRAVVDVELDRLTGGGRTLATGLAAVRDSETYYLNDEYVRDLDAEMEFYEASGIGVYLRFSVSDPEKWFGAETNEDRDDPRNLSLYLALTSFFCGRYGNVSSIIIPDVRSGGSLWEDACSEALLARLTFAAASANYESFTVTIPVAGLGEGNDGEIFAAFIAESLHQTGEIPWSLLTVSDRTSFDGLNVPITSSRANGTASPSFSALIWTPEGKTASDAAQIFLDLCKEGNEAGSRAVILSVRSFSGAGLFDYSILRGNGGKRGDKTFVPVDFSAVEPLVASSSVLWDFRDSYSTKGWVAGSGIGTFGTAFFRDRSGGRVLRATLDAESSHGILLKTFPEEISFSRFPLIEFDLFVSSDTGAVVTFMFGTDGEDAEYVLDCPPGAEERRVVCDLGEMSGAGGIKYFSLLIRSEGEATADVFRITAHSLTKTDGPIRIDGAKDGGGPGGGFDQKIVFIPVAAGIVLIPLGIHLFRSDRDASLAKARRRERGKK